MEKNKKNTMKLSRKLTSFKTAKKFIAAYGTMEGLLANTHELKGKMKEKV